MKGSLQKKYQTSIFLSGLVTNMALAIFITYIGDKLGLDLYLAVLVAFTIRMLNNIGIIRYSFLEKFIGGKKILDEKINEEKQTNN